MVSREQNHSHDYEHLMLDPAALGVSWAEPAALDIPPPLLAALVEYLSAAAGGDGDAEADDEFMMYEFKIRRCARARSHDWTSCPYAHPGEAAWRRDPRRVSYTGEPCPDFQRRPGAACPRGNACAFAHGTFELWLHPSRYRTRACRAGVSCRRRVCFFAHTAAELRAAPKVEESPLSLSPKSTLASLWESPPVSPVQGRRWIDAADEADEMEDLMLAMRELSFRKAAASSAPVLPLVTEEDGPDLGWVSELVM